MLKVLEHVRTVCWQFGKWTFPALRSRSVPPRLRYGCRMRNKNPQTTYLPSSHYFILDIHTSNILGHPRTAVSYSVVKTHVHFVWLFWYIEPHIGPSGERWAMRAASTILRGRYTTRLIPPHTGKARTMRRESGVNAREQYWEFRVPVYGFYIVEKARVSV